MSSRQTPKPDGYVYLIQAVGTNRYKIGMTVRSLDDRLSELQGQSPYPLECLGSIYVPDPKSAEAELHEIFADYRLVFKGSREWFEFSPDFIEDEVIPAFESIDAPEDEPEPEYAPRYYSSSASSFMPSEIIAAGAILAIVGLIAVGASKANREPQWSHFDAGTKAASIGDYDTAIINFERFAGTAPAGCASEYANQMAEAARRGKNLIVDGYAIEDAYNEYMAIADQADEQAASIDCWQ